MLRARSEEFFTDVLNLSLSFYKLFKNTCSGHRKIYDVIHLCICIYGSSLFCYTCEITEALQTLLGVAYNIKEQKKI